MKPQRTPDYLLVSVYLMFVFFVMLSSITGKKYLNEFPRPFLMTFMQGLCGSISSFFLLYTSYDENFITSTLSTIMNDYELLGWVLVGSFLQFLGTCTTNISTAISSNSFVNTIKATDPFFAGVLTKIILKEDFNQRTIIATFIIVFGVILACGSEYEFQMSGFILALMGLFCFPLRAVITKKISSQKTSPIDSQFLFWMMSLATMFFSLFGVVYEMKFDHDRGIASNSSFHFSLLQTSLTHYMYNILGFWLIPRIPALSFSIGNSIKRLIIVYLSLLYFGNPFSVLNLIAPGIVVFGVLLYSGSGSASEEKNLQLV